MRIYTRTGDAGETSLRRGERVSKDHRRIEVSGAVDELSAWLGLARAAEADAETAGLLVRIQQDLFALSAAVADSRPPETPQDKVAFPLAKVAELEHAIDCAEARLPPLKQFILPGGAEAGARLHLARTVCRRAERRLAALARDDAVAPVFLAYINRLSDLLFVLARVANQRAGSPEIPW